MRRRALQGRHTSTARWVERYTHPLSPRAVHRRGRDGARIDQRVGRRRPAEPPGHDPRQAKDGARDGFIHVSTGDRLDLPPSLVCPQQAAAGEGRDRELAVVFLQAAEPLPQDTQIDGAGSERRAS